MFSLLAGVGLQMAAMFADEHVEREFQEWTKARPETGSWSLVAQNLH